MAKVNMIGAMGAVFSLIGAGTFWMYALLTYSVIGSGVTDLERQMHALLGILALAYMLGAVIGTVSQLGALLQLPGLVIGLPFTWYLFHPMMYVLYFVGFLGTSLLIAAMFLDYSRAERMLGIPPFSRIRIWTVGGGGPGARPLPGGAAKVILAVLLASVVSAAVFAGYAWSAGVSNLHIELIIDGTVYGNGNISMSVDGEEVYSSYVYYDPSEYPFLRIETTCEVSAGSHLVEVDAWNGLVFAEGTVDTKMQVKVLPFTTEDMLLGLGVAFI